MGIENLTKLELFELRRWIVNKANGLDPENQKHELLTDLVSDIDKELAERYDAVFPEDEIFRV